MERNRRVWTAILIIGIIAVIGTTVAFALLSTTLNITGTGEVSPATWDIKFQNLSGPTITGKAEVLTEPKLSDTIIEKYDIRLVAPGDSITYTFDVQNAGDLNAEIGSFIKANTPSCISTNGDIEDEVLTCENLIYTLTYTNGGNTVGVGDTLAAHQSKNLTLKIEYPSTATSLPKDSVKITDLEITILYNQD